MRKIIRNIGKNFIVLWYKNFNVTSNIGNKISTKIIEKRPPSIVKYMASYPFLSKTILWEGRTDNAVDSSGTPNRIEAINDVKEWVTNIETTNDNKHVVDRCANKKGISGIIIAEILLGWITFFVISLLWFFLLYRYYFFCLN